MRDVLAPQSPHFSILSRSVLSNPHTTACRKRRIKCDEGKPICNNCIRSKRHCEGYSQRVVFKDGLGSFIPGGPYGPIAYQAEPARIVNHALPSQNRASSSQGPLPTIAPKPRAIDLSYSSSFQHGSAYHGQPRPQPHPRHSFDQHQYASSSVLTADHFMSQEPSGSVFSHSQHGQKDVYPGAVSYVKNELQIEASPTDSRQPLSFSHTGRDSVSSAQDELGQHMIEPKGEDDYWYSDDDASMAESEDEIGHDNHALHLETNDLGLQVAKRIGAPFDVYGTQMRTFCTFEDGVLDTYLPSSNSSPLNDPQTAAVFWYFVNVTGPSLSLYERHPFDPSQMFHGQPVPKVMQHIWTCEYWIDLRCSGSRSADRA